MWSSVTSKVFIYFKDEHFSIPVWCAHKVGPQELTFSTNFLLPSDSIYISSFEYLFTG